MTALPEPCMVAYLSHVRALVPSEYSFEDGSYLLRMANYYFECGIPASICAAQILKSNPL